MVRAISPKNSKTKSIFYNFHVDEKLTLRYDFLTQLLKGTRSTSPAEVAVTLDQLPLLKADQAN